MSQDARSAATPSLRVRSHFEAPGPDRWARRSRTLPGIAGAMAAQWGGLVKLAVAA